MSGPTAHTSPFARCGRWALQSSRGLRRGLSAVDPYRLLFLIGIGLLCALAVVLRHDAGATIDEGLQMRYGRRILSWYVTGFRDQRALSFAGTLAQYGGLFEVLAQLGVHFTPDDAIATRHVASALCAILGVVACFRTAERLGGSRAGLVAAFVLATTPAWSGHGLFNPKDIPFAAAAAWVVYGMVRLATDSVVASLGTCLICGLSLGAALGVRVGGMFLLAYPVIGLLARRARGAPESSVRVALPQLVRVGSRLLLCFGLAWTCMLLAWPWAQLSPLRRPFEAAWTAAHSNWGGPNLFRGSFVDASQLPRSYLPTWFAVTLPETYLLALCCALTLVWFAIRKKAVGAVDPGGLLCVCIAAFGPIGLAMIAHPTLYDAHRHFLFVLPPLATLAGLAISQLFGARSVPLLWRASVLGALVGLVFLVSSDMIALHPYEYVYFNRLSGGLRAAQSRFETDYWGASYAEGVRWVGDRLLQDKTPQTRISIAACADTGALQAYIAQQPRLAGRLTLEADQAKADIFLATTRFNCHKTPGQVLHVVERMGVPLLYVIQRHAIAWAPSAHATHTDG
jgi:hypothetical protein